jgi:hypothetical protein
LVLSRVLVLELKRESGAKWIEGIMRVLPASELWSVIRGVDKHAGQAALLFVAILVTTKLPVTSDTISKRFHESYSSYMHELRELLAEPVSENGSYHTLLTLADEQSRLPWILISSCAEPVDDSLKTVQPNADLKSLCYELACSAGADPGLLVNILNAMYSYAGKGARSFRECALLPLVCRPPILQDFQHFAAALASLQMTINIIARSNWVSAVCKNENCRDMLLFLIQFSSTRYTSRTVLVKHTGSAWDKLLMDSGTNLALAKLLIAATKQVQNIIVIQQLGGARALRDISSYCEDFGTRKDATEAMHNMLGLPELKSIVKR